MRGRAVRFAAALGVGVLYFGAGKLGLAFAIVHANATAVWPPTGIALAAGDLVVAPFLLLAARGKPAGAVGARDRPLEALLLGGISALIAAGVFHDFVVNPAHYPLTFLCLPPLLWSAFRFGARETSA